MNYTETIENITVQGGPCVRIERKYDDHPDFFCSIHGYEAIPRSLAIKFARMSVDHLHAKHVAASPPEGDS